MENRKFLEFTNEAIEKVLRTEVDKNIRFDFFDYESTDGENHSEWLYNSIMPCLMLKIPDNSCVTQGELQAIINALKPYGIRVTINVNYCGDNGTCLGFHSGY
jgi:hypothetical protein